MASYSVAKAKHATLTGATADDVTITGGFYTLRVTNAHASNTLYFNYNSATVPTSAADDTHRVPAGGTVTLRARGQVLIVRLVGTDNPYSVEVA